MTGVIVKENRLDAVSNGSEFSDQEIFAHFDFALIEDKRSSKSLLRMMQHKRLWIRKKSHILG